MLASASDSVIKTWEICRFMEADEGKLQSNEYLCVKKQLFNLDTNNGCFEFKVSLDSSFIAHDAPINSLRYKQ